MTALWVSIGLHVFGFLFWSVATFALAYRMKRDHDQREAELETTYEEAVETLRANINNTQRMAREYNAAYIQNVYRRKNEES